MSKSKDEQIYYMPAELDINPRGVQVDRKALVEFLKKEIIDQKYILCSAFNKKFGLNDNFRTKKTKDGKKTKVCEMNHKLREIIREELKNVRIRHASANGNSVCSVETIKKK